MTTRGRKQRPGRITFIGSGPGDPGLLTTRARTVLANAALIITDPDVPEAVLALAGSELPPPSGPEPERALRSMPRSRASRRTIGLANSRPSCAEVFSGGDATTTSAAGEVWAGSGAAGAVSGSGADASNAKISPS